MEEEEKVGRHWRTTTKALHCGVEILPLGKDIEYIVIERIDYVKDAVIKGRVTKGETIIAQFKENPYTKLPMIINPTNAKRLERLSKTPFLNILSDFAVCLTQEDTTDAEDGGKTKGLRFSKRQAKQPPKPILDTNHINWSKSIDYLNKGNTIEKLRQYYEISKEVEDLLNNEVEK